MSLVPLRDLVTMGSLGIGGNLLVLAALGFFAPMRFAALASLPRILALGVGCSAMIEIAQYVLRLDRVSSVDDVLINSSAASPRHTTAPLPSAHGRTVGCAWWYSSPLRSLSVVVEAGAKSAGQRGRDDVDSLGDLG